MDIIYTIYNTVSHMLTISDTSPPKMTLMDLAQNLLMAKLVPMALVYFGTESCALGKF